MENYRSKKSRTFISKLFVDTDPFHFQSSMLVQISEARRSDEKDHILCGFSPPPDPRPDSSSIRILLPSVDFIKHEY